MKIILIIILILQLSVNLKALELESIGFKSEVTSEPLRNNFNIITLKFDKGITEGDISNKTLTSFLFKDNTFDYTETQRVFEDETIEYSKLKDFTNVNYPIYYNINGLDIRLDSNYFELDGSKNISVKSKSIDLSVVDVSTLVDEETLTTNDTGQLTLKTIDWNDKTGDGTDYSGTTKVIITNPPAELPGVF